MSLSQQQKLIDMTNLKNCRIDQGMVKQEPGLLMNGFATASPAISSPTPSSGILESDKDVSNVSFEKDFIKVNGNFTKFFCSTLNTYLLLRTHLKVRWRF